MAKYKEFSGKMAVGLFVEGHYLHVVCLAKQGNQLKLVDGQMVKMSKTMETVHVQKEIFSDGGAEDIADLSDAMNGGNGSGDMPDETFSITEKDVGNYDNIEVLQRVLFQYPSNKFQMGIAISEPQIYYMYFGTDWGLQGEKLKKRVIEEVSRERNALEMHTPDAIYNTKLGDGRLMAIVRESEVNVINSLQYLQSENRKVLPKISFVESAETALVNLVNANYFFNEQDLTIIVYLGNEYSRLTFLQGHEIYNISYIIGAGLDSENITHTIYSRILLEQDNLNLPQVQNIILTGEAYQVNLKEFLQEKLSEDIAIDYLKLPNLDVEDEEIDISKYAVAIGSAWRTAADKEPFKYDVDLLPHTFRESQKRFKLGLIGWLLLFALPAVSFLTTVKVIEQRTQLTELLSQQETVQQELNYLQDIEAKLIEKRKVLDNYQKAFGVVDEMSVGIERWNKFLYKLSQNQDKVGRIWITDVIKGKENDVLLKGYSVYKDRIPLLSNAMSSGDLNSVLVQKIRERTVYQFEMNSQLPTE
ncbi:MAG: hypothetical protein EH225_06970 [Calditrichaeota bacterium]|nr:hypothetical protein [Calditrichota bacterium]RQV92992.1 MAG: hypothetical protein EH221_10490 [bacterium]RQW03545.1 MAG: hypothetical protein EH225_06970 [Calditrichota bacterium]